MEETNLKKFTLKDNFVIASYPLCITYNNIECVLVDVNDKGYCIPKDAFEALFCEKKEEYHQMSMAEFLEEEIWK